MAYTNTQRENKTKLPDMSGSDLNLLKAICKTPSTSQNEKMMTLFICNWLKKNNIDFKIDAIGNIIADKTTLSEYPVVCCHIDTVQAYSEFIYIIEQKAGDRKRLYAANAAKKQIGIGGDDKCGIFACMKALQNSENIKAVFFTQEEVGCVGSDSIDLTELSGATYVIGVDRWGASDYINRYFAQTTSKDFDKDMKPLLKKYGYNATSGLTTDSLTLSENGIGVSCINLSCGYYQHHSEFEFIDTNELNNCVNLVLETITTVTDVYPHAIKKQRFQPEENWEETWAAQGHNYKKKELTENNAFLIEEAIRSLDMKEMDWDNKDTIGMIEWYIEIHYPKATVERWELEEYARIYGTLPF